jgi:hypothetical protein
MSSRPGLVLRKAVCAEPYRLGAERPLLSDRREPTGAPADEATLAAPVSVYVRYAPLAVMVLTLGIFWRIDVVQLPGVHTDPTGK